MGHYSTLQVKVRQFIFILAKARLGIRIRWKFRLAGGGPFQPCAMTFLLSPHDGFDRRHCAFREPALFRKFTTTNAAKFVAFRIYNRCACRTLRRCWTGWSSSPAKEFPLGVNPKRHFALSWFLLPFNFEIDCTHCSKRRRNAAKVALHLCNLTVPRAGLASAVLARRPVDRINLRNAT